MRCYKSTAVRPDRVGEFQEGAGKGASTPRRFGARQSKLAGRASPVVATEIVRHTFVENLRFAVEASQKQGRIKCLPRPSAFSASGLVPKLNATRDRSVGVQIRRTTRQLGAAETGSAPGSSIAHHKRRDRTWTSDSSDSGSWEHPWLPT